MTEKNARFSPVKLVLGVLLAAAAFFGYRHFFSADEADAGQYRTEPVQRGDLSSAISATGTLGATATVEVGTQVSGTLQSVDVDFNDNVEMGQIIARIDPSTFQARVSQAEAALASARANLAEARAGAVNAQKDYSRKSQLAERQLVSNTDRDMAAAQRDQAQARVMSAQALIQQQAANLNTAKLDLAKTIIRSPVKGTVLARNVEPGQTVAASLQTPVLFKIAGDLTAMEIILAIDEADIGQVRVGQSATFSVDAYPEKSFQGQVKQIRLSANNVSNVITYPVVIEVSNNEQNLLPGMTATAQIITSRKNQVLTIPSAALRFRPASIASAQSASPMGAPSAERTMPSAEERAKRMKAQLTAMRDLLAQMKVSEQVLAVFDQSAADYEKQIQVMMQRMAQGSAAGSGASQGAAPNAGAGQQGGGNRSNRFAERFAKSFENVRSLLDGQQQARWDQQIQSLFNAKRATAYVLENGEPKAVEIRLGASDGSRTEVIGGLSEGQQVIVGSARQIP